MAQVLLAAGADPNTGMLKVEDKVIIVDRTALMENAWAGRTDVVRLLLTAGADPNAKDHAGQTALMEATEEANGDAEIVKMLIAAGAKVDARNEFQQTALIEATLRFSVESVNELLKNGADVNAAQDDGKTALIYAAEIPSIPSNDANDRARFMKRALEIVKILLSRNADRAIKDKYRMTALDYAEKNNHADIARTHKAAGA